MTITIETIRTALAADRADDQAQSLGHLAGSGEPTDPAFADSLGPDFICALGDGRCVAWGADRADGREVVIYGVDGRIDETID